MDSALEKMGLYDFFGVLLSGIVSVTICYLLQLPIMKLFTSTRNSGIDTIIFLLACFFVGLLLQEIGSFMDKQIWKFKKNAQTLYLQENNKIIKNELEAREVEILSKEILKGKDKSVSDDSKCEFIFNYCKTRLELENKCERVNRINSLYGMSRSFLVSIPIITLLYIGYSECNCATIWMIIGAVIVWRIFYWRTKRFAEYRVRVVFRLYLGLDETTKMRKQ